MRAAELVRSMANKPVEAMRQIPKVALTRIMRALEDRGVIPKPWSEPVEELVVVREQWGPSPARLPGIELHVSRQLEQLDQMRRHANDLPDFHAGSFRYRYQPRGSSFAPNEAMCLHLMMRVVSPKKIFELGAHDARSVMLDTIDRSFKQPIEVVSLDRKALSERARELSAGDILFVDHPDLAPILFEVLPLLSAGVYVQLRPVHYPFRDAALLRAFLMYNADFQIRFWPSYLHQHCRDRLASLPQIASDAGALWIRKVS